MNDERQSRLLADFLDTLRQDSQARPPADLDSDLAAMARLLVASKAPPPDAAVRERVWQRALNANRTTTRVSANGRTAHRSDKENTMSAIARPLPRGRSTHPFTLAAALTVVAMAALLFISRPPSSPDSGQPGLVSNPEQQEATATPIPSAIPTNAFIEHRVQAGETLAYIAQLYGFTSPTALDQIIAINPDVGEGALTEGTVILIPLPSPVPTPFVPTVVPPGPDTAMPVPSFAPSLVPSAPIAADAIPTTVPGVTTVTVDPAQPPTVMPPAWALAEPEPISLGDTVTGELTPDLPQLTYRFTAEANGPVFARARSEDLTALGIGFQVMNEGGGGGGGGGGSGDRATTQEISAAQYVYAGDQVTVLVNNAAPETGSFTLNVQQAEAEAIGYGETVEGAISEAQPVAYYRFNGEQGDVVTVRVSGENGYDTRLTLSVAAENFELAFDDDGGPAYDPEIYRQELSGTGEFAILVQPGANGGGRFTLTLEREALLSLDEGTQQIQFNSKYQPRLVFDGEAGQTVQLNVRAVAGSASARFIGMRVFQNGALIADISRDFGQLSAATEPAAGAMLSSGTVTAPQDGRVLVEVIALTTLAGEDSLTVEVEAVPAA